MQSGQPIGVREREVLTAVVETFIATGEPVGSRTLARSNSEKLSPASIRNVMADLSDAGFLEQPHTSAGRIPTTEAYRYYVEQLTGTARLSHENENIIQGSLAGISDPQDFGTHLACAVVDFSQRGRSSAVGGPKNALEHVYFSRLGDQKVLAVLVTRSGVVRDRVLRMDLPQTELDMAARFINENFRGWTMESMRVEIARRLEQERSEYDRLMSRWSSFICKALGWGGWPADGFCGRRVQSGSGGTRPPTLQELLQTLEEKQKIIELLGVYLDTKQEAVRVVIGLDEAMPSMRNFVLIGAPARVGGEVMGSLAVIGPTRIDYQHTMSAVSYIARMFDKVLNESE